MNEQDLDFPCPICSATGQVKMITHIDEIPYFGEHTQLTLMCNACGWTQTDFIPAEGKKAGGWTLLLDEPSKLRARVVRSSSCTVLIPELDLQVNPGSSSTGYVSNVEGVILRFQEIIAMVQRDVMAQLEEGSEEESLLEEQLQTLVNLTLRLHSLSEEGATPLTLELLDPHGHSMILHEDALERTLSEEELEKLPVGPDPAVFSTDEMDDSA